METGSERIKTYRPVTPCEDMQKASEPAETAYKPATRKRVANGRTRPRIYDPETGKYLKDEIVQSIEDSFHEPNPIIVHSMEEYDALIAKILADE